MHAKDLLISKDMLKFLIPKMSCRYCFSLFSILINMSRPLFKEIKEGHKCRSTLLLGIKKVISSNSFSAIMIILIRRWKNSFDKFIPCKIMLIFRVGKHENHLMGLLNKLDEKKFYDRTLFEQNQFRFHEWLPPLNMLLISYMKKVQYLKIVRHNRVAPTLCQTLSKRLEANSILNEDFKEDLISELSNRPSMHIH